MAYIGKTLDYGTISKQVLTANGSTTVFTLDQVVRTAKELIVSVGGVVQEPDVVYSASGTTLTFTTAPINGHRVWVIFLGRELSDGTYQDNVMTTAKFQNNAVTNAKIAALAASKLTGALPAISGAALTGVATDFSAQYDNISMLGFKLAAQENLAKYDLVDQMVDEYYDTTGIDAGTSTGESTGGSGTGKYYIGYEAAVSAVAQLADHSSSNRTLTVTGGAAASTTQKKFGTHGLDAGGANDNLSVPASSDWNFTSDWTCEGWFYRTGGGVGSYELINFRSGSGGGGNGLRIFYESRKLKLNCNTIGLDAYLVSSTSNLDDAWHHIAVVRSGNSIKGYIDGSSDGTTLTASGNNTSTGTLHIAGDGDQGFTGYMDEMRISNTARYTSNFTPSTTEFTPDANTLLLIHVNAVSAVTAVTGMDLVSTSTTALAAPATSSLVTLIENSTGTATLNTDIKGYVSRNGGTGWDQVTLVDEGTWGTNKKILAANDKTFSNSASGTDMKYKIETANQSGSKQTRVHAVSMGWK